MTRENWNEIYTGGKFDYERQPNRFLVRALEYLHRQGLSQGLLLDCAMGEGRNSIYAAQQGFNVYGFDISDEAMRHAEETAQKAGLCLHTCQAEADGYDYGFEKWDVILVLFYPAIRRILGRIQTALKPGGFLILASPMAGMEKIVPGAHPDILDNLYLPGELSRTFQSYETIFNAEILDFMDFFREARIPMVEFMARKPLNLEERSDQVKRGID